MTLKEILNKRYEEAKKEKPVTDDFDSFYNTESRKWTDILNLLGLEKWAEKLKSKGEYDFSEEEARFVDILYKEYSGKDSKLDPIRRGDSKNFNAEFVKRIYNGFMKMFRERKASGEELSQIDLKLQESLLADYHIAKARYNRTKAQFDIFFERPFIINISDYMEFLNQFTKEFEGLSKLFIKRMKDLAEIMEEIRCEEFFGDVHLESEMAKMSDEEQLVVNLEYEYIRQILYEIENDEKLKDLKQNLDSLQNSDKKLPYKSKIKKRNKELEGQIAEREREIEKRVIEDEHTEVLRKSGKIGEGERFVLPKIENPYKPSSEGQMYSKEVLALALKRLKEDDETSKE
uniref:Uncharacterized protein n=1 Tax=uncultured Spirochaetaceae bacterium TaxID=201186 RepID=A0A650ER05_9SPIO|nr:hypothetical protein Unknown280_0860 [uncultured Spirochaetaceae bacterium]